MKQTLKRALIPLLAVSMMTGSLAACGGGSNASPAPAASNGGSNAATSAASGTGSAAAAITPFDPPVTVTVYGLGSTITYQDGPQTDPIAQIIKDKLGIILNMQQSDRSNDTLAAAYASGDMGDLMQFAPNSGSTLKGQLGDLAKSGLILPLDDLIAQYGPDIQKLSTQLQFTKDNYNVAGDGKQYCVIGGIQPAPVSKDVAYGLPLGIVTRWDYYAAMGYPTVNSLDSWLGMVKDMVQKYPTNDAGQQRYGFAYFGEWGWATQCGHIAKFLSAWDGDPQESDYGNGIMWHIKDNSVTDRWAPDSEVWKALSLFNKANQMGILDPNYMTNKWADINTLSDADRLLSNIWSWSYSNINNTLAPQGKGYVYLPLADGLRISLCAEQPMGTDFSTWIIPKSCKNQEAAMRLLNWFCSVDGCMAMLNGTEGKDYTLQDGKYVQTQSFIDLEKQGGTNYIQQTGAYKYYNQCGLLDNFTNPNTGQALRLLNPDNSAFDATSVDFAKHYNIPNANYTYNNTDPYINLTITSLLGSAPDDIIAISKTCGDYLNTEGPKLIDAKTDADFQAGVQAIYDKLISMGWQKVVDWSKQDWAKANSELAKYK